MRQAGWILGIAASILLGPVIYLVARLVEAATPSRTIPLAVPVRPRPRPR